VKALLFGLKRLKVLKYRCVNGLGQIASGRALHQLCEERPAADLRREQEAQFKINGWMEGPIESAHIKGKERVPYDYPTDTEADAR
jgi:hypothetical protein